jgi:hypothetical protein
MLSNRQAHSLHFFSAVEIIFAQTSLQRYRLLTSGHVLSRLRV